MVLLRYLSDACICTFLLLPVGALQCVKRVQRVNACSTAVEAFSLILLLTSKTLQSGANREVKNTNKD